MHVTDFPAAVKTGPAVAEIELRPPAGYWIVHSRAATEFAPEVRIKFKEAVPALDAAADERLNVCAPNGNMNAIGHRAAIRNRRFDT